MNKFSLQRSLSKPSTYSAMLCILPMAFTLGLILFWGVNVPFRDDWALIDLCKSIQLDGFNFSLLFSQHNEHRILFPKLIFLGLEYTLGWNLKVQMLVNYLLTVVNFFLILRISNFTTRSYDIQPSNLIEAFMNFLFSLLIFSVVQWENFLWGFQIAWFLILTCLLLSIYILLIPKIRKLAKVLISASLCFIASFSSAHGLLTWIALVPILIAICGSLKDSLKVIIFWFSSFILTTLLYFHSYHKPSYHPDLSFFLDQPFTFIKYFISIFGSPFQSHSIVFGFLALIIFMAILTKYIIGFLHNVNRIPECKLLMFLSPWISISLFVASFAIITSLGRSGFGVEQALASRYTSIMILIYISNIYVSYIFFLKKFKSRNSRSKIFKLGILIGVFLSLLISSIYDSSRQSLAHSYSSYESRSKGKLCLEFIKYIDQSSNNLECLKNLYPDPTFIMSNISTLENLSFLSFTENSKFLKYNEMNQSSYQSDSGFIDSPQNDITLNDKSSPIRFQGWAKVSSSYQNFMYPNIIFFSVNNSDSFFATTHTYIKRRDVADHLGSNEYLFSGWSIDLNVEEFPQGNNKVTAWIYNQSENIFIPLNHQPMIEIK